MTAAGIEVDPEWLRKEAETSQAKSTVAGRKKRPRTEDIGAAINPLTLPGFTKGLDAATQRFGDEPPVRMWQFETDRGPVTMADPRSKRRYAPSSFGMLDKRMRIEDGDEDVPVQDRYTVLSREQALKQAAEEDRKLKEVMEKLHASEAEDRKRFSASSTANSGSGSGSAGALGRGGGGGGGPDDKSEIVDPLDQESPFTEGFMDLMDHYKVLEEDKKAMFECIPISKALCEVPEHIISEGERRYTAVEEMCQRISSANGFKLEATQIEFIVNFAQACAPKIFGKDWIDGRGDWYKKHNLQQVDLQVMCLTPRRFGKTTSVVVFVLALLLCVPGLRVIILSQGMRSSGLLLELMKRFLHAFDGGTNRIAYENKGTLAILPREAAGKNLTINQKRNYPGISSVVALPSTADGTFFLYLFLYQILKRDAQRPYLPCFCKKKTTTRHSLSYTSRQL